MLTTNFLSGLGANYLKTLPETVYPPLSQTVAFTSATAQTRIKLPNYVNTIRVYAWGGGGAGGGKGPGALKVSPSPGAMAGGIGGDGGFVQADFPVPPGAILYVRVAGGGKNYAVTAPSPSADFANGGGGGYSSVELPRSFPTYHLVVAAGGGGGGKAPPATSPVPSPTYPTGPYTAGADGGPAFADGSKVREVFTDYLPGKGASSSAVGRSGIIPIGEVPVPRLGPVYGPIYGPVSPGLGPYKRAPDGGFLSAGGDAYGDTIWIRSAPLVPSPVASGPLAPLTPYTFTSSAINGGGHWIYGPVNNPPFSTLSQRLSPADPSVPPGIAKANSNLIAWPDTNYENEAWSIKGAGGGGGYYGGGMAAPQEYFNFTSNFGEAGGGGGSSYINPTGTNRTMANTAPGYTPNPIYVAYATAALPDDTKAATGRGGHGGNFPPATPFPIRNAAWTAQQGGDGLVVIVY